MKPIKNTQSISILHFGFNVPRDVIAVHKPIIISSWVQALEHNSLRQIRTVESISRTKKYC